MSEMTPHTDCGTSPGMEAQVGSVVAEAERIAAAADCARRQQVRDEAEEHLRHLRLSLAPVGVIEAAHEAYLEAQGYLVEALSADMRLDPPPQQDLDISPELADSVFGS